MKGWRGSGLVEDQPHFLTFCPKYDNLRVKLYGAISKKVSHFESLTSEQIFVFIMQCENFSIIRHLGNFISDALQLRSSGMNRRHDHT